MRIPANFFPGNTGLHAADAAKGAARQAGIETINFIVTGTGIRTATVIGELGTGRMLLMSEMKVL